MSKELKEIIQKLISENPDIIQISAHWDSRTCNGIIWVQIPGISGTKRYTEFLNNYTEYVNDTYGNMDPAYDECSTLVCAQSDPVADEVYPLVYDRERGIIEDAV